MLWKSQLSEIFAKKKYEDFTQKSFLPVLIASHIRNCLPNYCTVSNTNCKKQKRDGVLLKDVTASLFSDDCNLKSDCFVG